MTPKKINLVTRRQAIASLATLTAGALLKPASVVSFAGGDSKTRFAVLGDFGTGGSDEFGVASQMLETHHRSELDLILTVGDNIYPNGSGRHFAKRFEEPFAGLLKERVKFYAVLGNHDVEEGRKISRGNGVIDFFMLDSTDCESGQVNWLENSLRDSRAKWKVAALHHPIYSSGKKHGSDVKVRKTLEPLFKRYHVQVVFAGHDHVYERTKPQDGVQYFITGAGGQIRRGDIDMQSELRAASFDRENSFMYLEVDENEMAFKSISEKGEVVDSGVIKQA